MSGVQEDLCLHVHSHLSIHLLTAEPAQYYVQRENQFSVFRDQDD